MYKNKGCLQQMKLLYTCCRQPFNMCPGKESCHNASLCYLFHPYRKSHRAIKFNLYGKKGMESVLDISVLCF